jgi:hypothetical protein
MSDYATLHRRKRGDTRSLLGSAYEEVITKILDPPQPLQDISDYTPERIKEALKYADVTLRNPQRKLSPAGALAIQMYKDSCMDLLKILDVEEGEVFETSIEERKEVEQRHRVFIREAEKSMQINACLRATRTTTAQELQDEILQLQRTAFYGRYGDYFAEVCKDLKNEAQKGNLAGWQTLSGKYWSEIAERVEDEQPIYGRFLKGESGLQSEMPTIHAIQSACYRLGLYPKDTLEIVKQYGTRNNLLHANLLPLIKGGLFASLAKRLHLDYCDLPLLVPASDKADLRILEALLNSMIDLWFVRDESDPQNHEMWIPTDQLRDYRKRLNEKTPRKGEAEINKEISKAINKAYKRNLKDSTNQDEMVERFGKITGKKIPPKRVASAQLEDEIKRFEEKKKMWDAIVNVTNNVKKMYDTYMITWREIGAPGETIEDKDL